MLLSRLTQQFGLVHYRGSVTSLVLCLFAATSTVACGGHIIPIGGEPIDTDDTTSTTDTTTHDTTKPDDSDTTDGTGDDGNTSDGSDDNTSGGGSTGSGTTPSGVYCEQYAACDVNTPCKAGECIAFAECGTAICIDGTEACKLSCPVAEDCALLESYPAQLACEGKVPAHPGKPGTADECTVEGGKCLPPDQSAPPSYTIVDFACSDPDYSCWAPLSTEPGEPTAGVKCENYKTCDAETPCADGQNCIAFREIGTALCISSEEACKLSCPDPTSCAIAESYPEQLSCPNQIDATCSGSAGTTGDAGAPVGVACEEHETCDALDPCDEGSCIKVPGCDAPLCIDAALACKQACGQSDCPIAESYPEQLFCNEETEPGQDPDQPVSSNDAGVSVPGWPGPDAGDAAVE